MSAVFWPRPIASTVAHVIAIVSSGNPVVVVERHKGEVDRRPLGHQYVLFLAVLALSYTVAYGWLLMRTDFLPYVMDNNESFSSFTHAANLYHFGLSRSFGLTDEAYGSNPAAHPYVYTHGGNFPRLFAFILYVLGARSIESHILITTFTIGAVAVFFAYHYFSEVSNALFAFIASLVLITDYIFFAQWQVDTYRVWHGFFVFSSLLCAHNIGGKGPRLWMNLTFINYLCLFYFEYTFVAFVAIFVGLYTAWIYARSPRVLLKAWGVQVAGALSGILVLVVQLVGYMGFSGLVQDVYLTYIARNASDPSFQASLQQFYDSYNIVFWYNLVDSTSLRNLRSFMHLLFTWNFQVHTPLFTLIVLILTAGWFVGLVRWRFRLSIEQGIRSIMIPRTVLEFEASRALVRVYSCLQGLRFARARKVIRPLLVFGPFALSSYLLLIAISRDQAFLGLPSTNSSFWHADGLPMWVSVLGAVLGCLALAKLAANRWRGLTQMPLGPVARANLLMLAVGYIVRNQSMLYEQGWQPLWLGTLESWLPGRLNQATVVAAAGVAVAMALVGSRRALGQDGRGHLQAMLKYLGCGFLAYVFVYALSPGYILTGYLYRSAPLGVFLTDVLVAIAIYVALTIGVGALRQLPAFWRASMSWTYEASASRPCLAGWPGRVAFFAAAARVVTSAILGSGLFLFAVGYWLNLQTTYLTLLPPNYFAFLKNLNEPPYKDASFVVYTYAAPISVSTGKWAYLDPRFSTGNIRLTDSGYLVDRDADSYLWLADKRENRSYLKPDYYACMMPQNLTMVLGRITNQAHHYGICSRIGIVQRSRSGNQHFLQHSLIAIDRTGHDSWALVKLDWDYPPYLRPLPGSDPNTRVYLGAQKTDRGTAVDIRYEYAHQEGKAESGSLVRLYSIADSGSMCLLQGVRTSKQIFLAPEFSGKIRASVTPHTSTKAGPEYFSQVVRVGSATRPNSTACPPYKSRRIDSGER